MDGIEQEIVWEKTMMILAQLEQDEETFNKHRDKLKLLEETKEKLEELNK